MKMCRLTLVASILLPNLFIDFTIFALLLHLTFIVFIFLTSMSFLAYLEFNLPEFHES